MSRGEEKMTVRRIYRGAQTDREIAAKLLRHWLKGEAAGGAQMGRAPEKRGPDLG